MGKKEGNTRLVGSLDGLEMMCVSNQNPLVIFLMPIHEGFSAGWSGALREKRAKR